MKKALEHQCLKFMTIECSQSVHSIIENSYKEKPEKGLEPSTY